MQTFAIIVVIALGLLTVAGAVIYACCKKRDNGCFDLDKYRSSEQQEG